MIDAVENKMGVIKSLCAKYRIKRLELFGSASDGTFQPGESDIDFLVEFQPGADLGPWMSHYFEFRDELEKTLGSKVDLVMVTALKNPYFISEVNRTRSLLYAA